MTVIQIPKAMYKAVANLPRRMFGTRNDRMLKRYRQRTLPVNDIEDELRGVFDDEFARRMDADGITAIEDDEERDARTLQLRIELSQDLRTQAGELRERIAPLMEELNTWWQSLSYTDRMDEYRKDEHRKRLVKISESMDRDGIFHMAFAVVREASRRAQNHRHFDCQLIGGRVLYEGKIAEMKTGEGKTIVCHLAAFLRVLCGHKVHIITVNDYLVMRDAEFAKPIFALLGISVGYIQSMVDPGGREGVRKEAYGCDLTYGTNSEFGFDYLRDNMKVEYADQVQGRLDYVIVDEVDSILIDEARTPLIISGPARDDVSRYPRADMVAKELVRRQTTWDRRIARLVARFDGETHNIPKLGDAMNVLGYKERDKDAKKKDKSPPRDEGASDEAGDLPTLGPDFLTDDHAEALQIFENEILQVPPSEQYHRFFIVQMERKQVGLTHDGVTIAQELLDMGSLYSGANMEWPHLIENALRAHKVYQRDKDYVVQQGEIVIVDPFTGRLMHGRQWSDGLHQAIEAKESVKVKEETQTLATITIQNFIKLYLIKAGMTGTALTEGTEFDKIYKLDVVEIPTNRPINRVDHNDKMYRDADQKYSAIVDEIHEVHRRGRPADPFLLADLLTALRPILDKQGRDTAQIKEAIRQFNNAEIGDHKVIRFMTETYDEAMGDLARGRPVLVGTTSVENSEKLSKLLERRYGIDHEVLNAKNHSREADIVAKAGFCTSPTKGHDKTLIGNVTIATNMAGRGTDIKLGPGVVYDTCKVPETLPDGVASNALYPAGIAKCCINCTEYDPATNCAHCFKPKLDPRFPELGRKVCPINVPCGLHIVATERHEARRIDNQLRGRAGRQGDPGSSRFSLSLQDDLLKLFMPDWMLKMMEKLGFTDGSSLEDKRLSKGIERAQRKVEERNFATRKHLLEWDEPMDYQRKEFYLARQRILEERGLPDLIFETIDKSIDNAIKLFLSGHYDRTCVAQWAATQLDLSIEDDKLDVDDFDTASQSLRKLAIDEAEDAIKTSLGEYIDPSEPPKDWDLGGLLQWARRAYQVSMTQNQLRKMEPQDIEDALLVAAQEHVENLDLSPIEIYLEPEHPQRAMADWAKSKFAVELEAEDLLGQNHDEVRELLAQRIRDAYFEREVSYPVESCIERAFALDDVDRNAATEFVVQWANGKFDLEWEASNVDGKTPAELRDVLVEKSRSMFDGELARQVHTAVAELDRDDAAQWAENRFGAAWHQHRFDEWDGEWQEGILAQGREMLRYELTRLEQYVLLRIYDQAWKDHLLEMDHLKQAIMQRPLGGDQTHPQSQFAIEGRDLFSQMWARIAARVTDMIFKVRAMPGDDTGEGSGERAAAGGPMPMTFTHSDSTGGGFSAAARDRQAAMQAQGVEGKVETIRREKPKVGRNDPCPCGSGKKYKQCHGKQ